MKLSAMVNLSSIRLLLGFLAEIDLKVHHKHVTTVFINDDLGGVIFVELEQPETFIAKENEVNCSLLERKGSVKYN